MPANFWGVVSQATPTNEQFQRLKAGGVDSIRIPISWSVVQPTEGGSLNWSVSDALVKGAAQAGIEVLPYVYGAPSWAVAVDGRFGSPVTLPVKNARQRSAWTNFLIQAVLRYGPGGTFWAENPSVPVRPMRTWQIWNEENFEYFVARPKPADYGKLVNLSYSAIKAVDPGSRLLLGGMFARPKEAEYKRKPREAYFATEFLDQMYRTTPGVKSKFVGVALHPYTRTYRYLAPEIEEVRNVLKANHDAAKSLWITELGWSSQPPTHTNLFAKGIQGQAAELKGAFGVLSKNQRKWRLQQVYWFSVDDQIGTCNFCDGSGLFAPGFIPKPAWYAYARFAGGRPG
ncbi:MAG: hypothetical protein WBM00_12240 [Solirubrobacterales bacterium]